MVASDCENVFHTCVVVTWLALCIFMQISYWQLQTSHK